MTVVGAYVPIFSENFDGVTPPALPAGWVATNAVDPDMIFWQYFKFGSADASRRFNTQCGVGK